MRRPPPAPRALVRAAPSARSRLPRLEAMAAGSLIGREQERARSWTSGSIGAVAGEGGLVLLAGEAGVGKTRLIDELAGLGEAPRSCAARRATTPRRPTAPSSPRCARTCGSIPGALDDCGPLGEHLRLLLPELGPAPEDVDQATLREAIRCALVAVAPRARGPARARRPAVGRRGDARAARRPRAHPRGHRDADRRRLPLRRAARASTRCGGCETSCAARRALEEIALDPLDEAGTAALVEPALGERPSRPLARTDPRALPGTAVLRRGAGRRARRRGRPAVRRRRARARRGRARSRSRRRSATPSCCAAAS